MDPRFDLPLYTRAEVALQLGLPPTTLGAWLRSGALEAGSGGRGEPTITLAGQVESRPWSAPTSALPPSAKAAAPRPGRNLSSSGFRADEQVVRGDYLVHLCL